MIANTLYLSLICSWYHFCVINFSNVFGCIKDPNKIKEKVLYWYKIVMISEQDMKRNRNVSILHLPNQYTSRKRYKWEGLCDFIYDVGGDNITPIHKQFCDSSCSYLWQEIKKQKRWEGKKIDKEFRHMCFPSTIWKKCSKDWFVHDEMNFKMIWTLFCSWFDELKNDTHDVQTLFQQYGGMDLSLQYETIRKHVRCTIKSSLMLFWKTSISLLS